MDENKSGKDDASLGMSTGDVEQGNSQGFSPKATGESAPVRVLQLSESFFVADTLEDDESMIIPPTQEFLIPSTPPNPKIKDKESNISNINATTLDLDETYVGETEKQMKDSELMDDGSPSDMTQDLPELDATQPILMNRSGDSNKEDHNGKDDDDWELKFSETQETQELMGSIKLREMKEKEETIIKNEEKSDSTKEESTIHLETDSPKKENTDTNNTTTVTEKPNTEMNEESDDEVEPSQSCLSELQQETCSAFRDHLSKLTMDPPTAHSTPDNTLNDLKLSTVTEPKEDPFVPSPIIKHDKEQNSETKETTDVTFEDKPSKEPEFKEMDPVLVLDTEPEQPVIDLDSEEDKEKCEMVVDTIELLSTAGTSVNEETMKVDMVEEVDKKVIEVGEKEEKVLVVEDLSEIILNQGAITSQEEPEPPVDELKSVESIEEKQDVPQTETLPDTLPTLMLPPIASRLSRKQRSERCKKISGSQFEKTDKQIKTSIGTFKDVKGLEKIFSSFGIHLDHESSEAIVSLKPGEELRKILSLQLIITNNTVFLEKSVEIGPPNDQHIYDRVVSPFSGSSSSVTTSTVSTMASLHSGDIADIDTSSSTKSTNLSGMQFDTTIHSSQEYNHKTSTQNSEQQSFSNIKKTETSEIDKSLPIIVLSPIKGETVVPDNTKKRGRKAPAKSSNRGSTSNKRKRGKAPKDKTVEPPTVETNCVSKDSDLNADVRPRKTRRKKEGNDEPPILSPNATITVDVKELPEEESSDLPYGLIVPGVRVMARWKDGYYYPGLVVSQELEGRWSVHFDDSGTKTIPQENLIRVTLLERGTSVFAQSPDDYYDPGIVCGHFREGDLVGYEIELDSGVTKRYPRASVILSTDQAKQLTSTRPPTTPATFTINLDNIIDGKRKRRSTHAREPSASSAKKSPRTSSRISKTDPNLDNTAESSVTDKETSHRRNITDTTTETEEEVKTRQRSTRRRKAAKAVPLKIAKSLTDSSTKHPKLFKDYAFILTNADRKVMPKLEASDSEILTEEEEIVPFEKDELVKYILTGGGSILDSFDNVQTCEKKHVFLLANTYLRTMKYIQCLAAGIPCIKHHWVPNCCYKGEILNLGSYRLPAGRSIISDEIVEWHGKDDVLKGVKISLVSAPENSFVNTWAPVLLAAKADFVQKWCLPSSRLGSCSIVDILITNQHCPPDILQSAKRRKYPIVSSEWIIQSLIAGTRVPYDAHPKFKHDFTE